MSTVFNISSVVMLTFLLLLTSCVKDSESNVEFGNQQLAITSISSPEGFWSLSLKETKSLFDSYQGYKNVEDAVIRLEDITTGQEISFVHQDTGSYISVGHIPQKGHQYELFVETEKFGLSTSRTYVPSIGDAPIDKHEPQNVEGGQVLEFDLSIQSKATQNNFYVYEVLIDETSDRYKRLLIYNSEDIENYKEVFHPDTQTSSNPKGDGNVVFTSSFAIIDSVSTSSIIIAQPSTSDGVPQVNVSEQPLKIKIKAVSEDLYQFLKAENEYKRNSFIQSSNFQHSVENNIENGVGIFGAYTEGVITVY